MTGLLLLHKQSGITSFGALGAVKRAFRPEKAGHTGTLDKFASGLLLVPVGRALKLASWLGRGTKEYLGTVHLGEETDTLDPEGRVTARGPIPSRAEIEAVLPRFRGDILQAPPAYSALHVEGRRASELAREGKPPEMKERPVTVEELTLLDYDPPLARLHVRCSAGTYIRSLARDIAREAGSCAHLAALCRTRIGGFSLEEAAVDPADFARALKPLNPDLFQTCGIPSFFAEEKTALLLRQGRPLPPLLKALHPAPGEEGPVLRSAEAVAVFSGSPEEPRFTALLERKAGGWAYGYVLAENT